MHKLRCSLEHAKCILNVTALQTTPCRDKTGKHTSYSNAQYLYPI